MANAILFDILEAVRTDIQALSLAGLAAANIIIHKVPSTAVAGLPAERFPCIIIAPWGREVVRAGSNVRDDITYPVVVCIVASEKNEIEQPQDAQRQNFEMYLKWRETIRKSFSNLRLTSTLCHLITVAPLEIVDRQAWEQKGLFASGLILNCTQRESKGS